jgi:hypothetical protein
VAHGLQKSSQGFHLGRRDPRHRLRLEPLFLLFSLRNGLQLVQLKPSKYATREDAVADILSAVQELARRIEALIGRVKWSDELEKALQELKQALPVNTP